MVSDGGEFRTEFAVQGTSWDSEICTAYSSHPLSHSIARKCAEGSKGK